MLYVLTFLLIAQPGPAIDGPGAKKAPAARAGVDPAQELLAEPAPKGKGAGGGDAKGGGPGVDASANGGDAKSATEAGGGAADAAKSGDAAAAGATDAKASDGKTSDAKSGDGGASSDGGEGATKAGGGIADVLDDMLHSGAMGYMIEGGFFMWPILILGVLACGVIIERYRSLKMIRTDTSALRNQVQSLLLEDKVEEALKICDREQGPVPAVLSAGLRKYLIYRRLNYDAGKIEEQVVKGIDDYAVHIVAALERHLPILATVSSVAPMLGFLGTVQGMVVSFDDIVAQMGKTNIVEAAAAGIKVSLLTTVLGLVVGIPAFTAFNYFTSVINRFVLEVEESASELIEAVTLQLAVGKRDGETKQS